MLPNRAQVTMTVHFLSSYVDLLIQTCHKRGIHAMGGMAAQIPIKNDPEANAAALEKVRLDKLREVKAGHDGTWVAHPALVPIAKAVFDEYMPQPNQIDKKREDVHVTAADLLAIPAGNFAGAGLAVGEIRGASARRPPRNRRAGERHHPQRNGEAASGYRQVRARRRNFRKNDARRRFQRIFDASGVRISGLKQFFISFS
jgi:hypothetical protein